MSWFDVFKGANKVYSEFLVLRSEMQRLKDDFLSLEEKQAKYIQRVEEKIEEGTDKLRKRYEEFQDRYEKKEDELRARMTTLEGLLNKTLVEAYVKAQENRTKSLRTLDYHDGAVPGLEHHKDQNGSRILLKDLGFPAKVYDAFMKAGLHTIADAMKFRLENGDWKTIDGIGSSMDKKLLERLENILRHSSS